MGETPTALLVSALVDLLERFRAEEAGDFLRIDAATDKLLLALGRPVAGELVALALDLVLRPVSVGDVLGRGLRRLRLPDRDHLLSDLSTVLVGHGLAAPD